MRDWRPAVRPKRATLHVRRWQSSGAPSSANPTDLPQGLVATGALLGMLALDISPWLSILLAVVTYVGVMLLRSETTVRPQSPDEASSPDQAAASPNVGDLWLIKEAEFAARFGLTRAEREILPLLAHRLTDQEIARRRFTSPRTVSNQTASILGKLHLTSRREIAGFAAQHGLEFPPLPPHVPE